ncbi:Trafficking protein particle complex subunit 5 [Chamberlinius hualienensis]
MKQNLMSLIHWSCFYHNGFVWLLISLYCCQYTEVVYEDESEGFEVVGFRDKRDKPSQSSFIYRAHIVRLMAANKQKVSILERPLNKGKTEVNLSTFALLFSEIVQYNQNRVYSVPELQTRLSDMGQYVGSRILELLFLREKNFKREIKLLNMLLFVKSNMWKTLFGKEADKLEHANDDERTYYIIEKEPLVNKFISVPKDKGSLNCAAFVAGIIEAALNGSNFPCKVTTHWHKGTTFMIKFEESVIARDKSLEGK